MTVPSLRRDQPVPLYYQIEVVLRRAIEAGAFASGRLPTEEELVEQYGVSRMTVRSALRRLEEDGLIERHRARGTFVRPGASSKIERAPERLLGFEQDLRRQGVVPHIEVLSLERMEPPVAVARGLHLPDGVATFRLRRLGRAGSEPLWLESRFYPLAIGELMAARDLSVASVSNLLQEVLGTRIGAARLRVEATTATARQASHLEVPRGHALLVNEMVMHDGTGRPLEMVRAAFRGDRYAFRFDLPGPGGPAFPGDGSDPQTLAWPVLTTSTAPPAHAGGHPVLEER